MQGTWQFMSIHLLRKQDTRHEFRHDVESLVLWVVIYMALRYLKQTNLTTRVAHPKLFDASLSDLPARAPSAAVHLDRGGALKDKFLTDPMMQVRLESTPLDDYLGGVIGIFLGHYNLLSQLSCCRNRKEFARLTQQIAASNKRLNDPDYFLEIFDEDEFNSEAEWPADDKTEDQFPPRTQAQKDAECYESDSLVTQDSDQHGRYGIFPMVAPPAQRPATPAAGSPSPAAGVGSSPLRGKGKSKAKQSTPIYSSSPIASSSQGIKRKRSSSDEFLPPKASKRAKARGRR